MILELLAFGMKPEEIAEDYTKASIISGRHCSMTLRSSEKVMWWLKQVI